MYNIISIKLSLKVSVIFLLSGSNDNSQLINHIRIDLTTFTFNIMKVEILLNIWNFEYTSYTFIHTHIFKI